MSTTTDQAHLGPIANRMSLARIADLCIIGLAVVTAYGWYVRLQTDAESSRAMPKVGMSLAAASIDWKAKPATLAFILQDGCRYCDESIPFYKELLSEPRQNMQFAALFTHDSEHGRQYLTAHDIRVSNVAGNIKVPWTRVLTPTIAVCDSAGKILKVWIGRLSDQQKKELRAFIAHFG